MTANDSDESRRRKIEIAAYYLAEGRSFAPGHEATDWFAAEKSVGHEPAPAETVAKSADTAVAKRPKAAKPVKATQPSENGVPANAPKATKSRGKRPSATP